MHDVATSQRELALVRAALDEGDARHAAHHLAGAVAALPDGGLLVSGGVASEIDGLVARVAPGLDPHAPWDEPEFHGAAAVRALLLWRAGERASALTLLASAQAAVDAAPYVELLLHWLSDERVPVSVDPDALGPAAVRLASTGGTGSRFVPLLMRLHALWPLDPYLCFAASRALRVAGRAEEALALARRTAETAPHYLPWIAVASACRVLDDTAGLRQANLEALRADPNDLAVRLDLGDNAIASGDLDEATRWYDQVLDREPDHAWALPSALYVTWRSTQSRDALAQLRALAREGNPRAVSLYDEIAPYEVSLSYPDSSLVEGGSRARQEASTIQRLACSSFEPPSAVATLAELAGWSGHDELPVEFGEMPSPDPRVPRGPVEHVLWTFSPPGLFGRLRTLRHLARPAIDPAREDVQREVASLAGEPYDPRRWYAEGRERGRALGRERVRDLLGTMVHPPPRPEAEHPASWRFACQVAAAYLVSGVDDGWANSTRRSALLSLLHGPTDWTTTAAILVMVEVLRAEPHARTDILQLLLPLAEIPMSPVHYTCVYAPLTHRLRSIDDLDDATHERLARAEALHAS